VLNRSFAAPAPNHRWIADFTYVWTAEGCVILLSLHQRKLISQAAASPAALAARRFRASCCSPTLIVMTS
jgi:transposase InsO family protein